MITQPINYKQTDPRWKNIPYSTKGESSTIGGSGCGPTSVADLLATFISKSHTPETECAWAVNNGYKAYQQGTYYSYIEKRLNLFPKFTCTRLNLSSIYNNPSSNIHTTALNLLKRKGNCLIACMGKGPWTKSGHYILVWGYNEDNKCVLINDPASSKTSREVAKFTTFIQTVKYYWVITINNYSEPKEEKEEDDMDINKITNEDAHTILEKARAVLRSIKKPSSFLMDEINTAKSKGITDGSRPTDLCTREEAAVMALRAYQSDKHNFNLDEEINKAKDSNITDGSRPKDYCTREEAMVMAYRALEEAIKRTKSGDS